MLQDARLLLGGRAEDVVGAPVPLPTYLAHAGECMRLSSFEWTLPPLFPCSRLDSMFGACGTWHDSAQVVPASRVHLPSLSLFEGSARKLSRRHIGDSMLAANINQKTTSRRAVLKTLLHLPAPPAVVALPPPA